MGVINRDLNNTSVGTHIISEIIWDHLSTAIANVVWQIFVPKANPSIIADLMCASKGVHTYSQRRAI